MILSASLVLVMSVGLVGCTGSTPAPAKKPDAPAADKDKDKPVMDKDKDKPVMDKDKKPS